MTALEFIEHKEKHLMLLLICLIVVAQGISQPYIEKQTRHRFAQLTLGAEYAMSYGGKTTYLDAQGMLQSLDLKSTHKPRILVGGTHFWGHADFLIAIPALDPTLKKNNQEITASRGVETIFKFYPWRIQHHRFAPFLGISMTPFYYEQSNKNLEFGNGPELNQTLVPLMAGFTFNHGNHLIELGSTWNYRNRQQYFISRTEEVTIQMPPVYFQLSYRYMLETTLSAESQWESGRTESVTQRLAKKKKLNNWYVGAGLSSAFWLKKSSYNALVRPYTNRFITSLMPDFTVGYYLHNPDLNIALAYRGYQSETDTYGTTQMARRRSVVLELTKFLFDYHGFAPFLGPGLSYENLSFNEKFEGNETLNLSENQVRYGVTFGWDIRPNRIQSWILRTNLRWFPSMELDVEGRGSISFDSIEFNFIQWVFYPQRIMRG